MTPSNLILCKASAGSGKTFMLAKTYLQIVLDFEHEQYCNYDRILAVTFTNKATEEMKSRILKFLTEISQITSQEDADKSDIARLLLQENPTWNYMSMAWKAKIALSKILHDYSQFSIMTIDKFFNRIVKSFLFELKLQNTANVSMDTQQALDDSIAQMLSEYSHQEGHILSKWLKEISMDKVDDGKDWNPDNIIAKLSKELFKEHVARLDIQYDLEKIQHLLEKFKQFEDAFVHHLKSLSRSMLDVLQREGMMEGLFPANYFTNQLKKIAENPIANSFSDSVEKRITSDESPFKKDVEKKPLFAHYLSVWQQSIQPLALEFLDFKENNIAELNTYVAFKKHLKALALLSDVSQKMKEYRERNGIMLISDNNQLIQKVVGNTEASFLYEKLGNKFRFILLDEFQDTSTLQWKNFLPLIQEILSHREACKVLIVGDAKQAIYRFRGGNFQLIQQEVQNDLSTFWSQENSLKVLKENYRSYKEVVEFNNQIFKDLAGTVQSYIEEKYLIREEVTPLNRTIIDLYNKEAAQIPISSQVGFVEAKFHIAESKKKSSSDDEDEDAEDLTKDDIILDYVKSTIEKLVHEKSYIQSDIAVLVRTNKEAIKVSDFLKTEGYSVMTSEALLFDAHPVIQLLIAALELMLHPNEDLFQSAILYKYAVVHQRLETEAHLLDLDKRKTLFQEWMPSLTPEKIVDLLGSLSIFEIIRKLMDTLELEDFRDAYTEQFLDMVLQYQLGAYQASIIDFLDWWKMKGRSISISDQNEAIQVLTIHKSKGLEYKVVIIPYFDWEMVNFKPLQQNILWPELYNSEEMQGFTHLPIDHSAAKDTFYVKAFQEETILQFSESLNVAYVALTRASEKLYIFSYLKKTKEEIKRDRIGELMYHAMQAHPLERFVDDLTYQYGEELPKIIKVKPSSEQQELLHVQKKTSDSTYELAPLNRQNQEAIVGEMIHEMISAYHPQVNLDTLMLKFSHSYHLEAQQREDVFARVRAFFTHSDIQQLYQLPGRILTERSFVFENELHRFDFLILNGKEGQLYDFKTGLEKSNHAQNKRNILLYKSALEQMGYQIQKTAFIYIGVDGLPKFGYIE